MCGIIGYIGKSNAIPKLINGLKALEYRGYDSAGIAYVKDEKIKILKHKGKITNLEKILIKNDEANLGIGHTRWATHGIANSTNSHPHRQGSITLVHNGIIENYQYLKAELIKEGYKFSSDTDSEVAAAYLDYLYQKKKDILKTLTEASSLFKGSYALGIIVDNDYTNLYAIRKDSPLIIGIGEEENFIASDVPAILDYTNKYVLLDNLEIAIISKNNITIYKDLKEVKKEVKTYDFDKNIRDKNGYDHFMLKEINEQGIIIKSLAKLYNSKEKILNNLPNIAKYNKVYIVACGSAYHAGMVGKYLIEEYGNIEVNVDIASEFRYKKLFLDNKTLVIAISQSGETADTLASIRIAKEYGSYTLGIVNSEGSSIAREVDDVIYTKAGIEVAVATTKGYTSQIFILALLALSLAFRKKYLTDEQEKMIFNNLNVLPTIIDKLITTDYSDITAIIKDHNNIFFLGRNSDYVSILEGSLKLKEISYIHSEAYAAGELKHGTISLIEEGTPIISLITNDYIADKTISNIKETKARGSYSIVIATNNLEISKDCFDKLITIDKINNLFQPIINIIPLQLIAYNVAKARGCDIDKPRNLAKSVTVE
jgi:glucosamine--fructose-6-phosphate aminotransferase (isomerizing)